jgi:hypothetical protein
LDAEYKESPYPLERLEPHAQDRVRRLVVHPFRFGEVPPGEIVIMREEVERFEHEHGITKDIGIETETRAEIGKSQKTEELAVEKYITKCLVARMPREKIAVELKEKYKLSYLEIGRSLNAEGLNAEQISALKKRGQRLCEKGLKLITEEKKGQKATK